MTIRSWAARIVLFAGGLFLSLILITFLAVQIQQRTLRWRAERLSADMHQIRLYQTTWADAQRLMHHWGAWGHYDGSCTAASCKYEIELNSVDSYSRHTPPAWLIWLLRHDRLNLYQWSGGRCSVFHASFTVHDGTIWREGAWMAVSVPRRRMRRVTNANTVLNFDDFDWTLSVGAGSRERLQRTQGEFGFSYMSIFEDELAKHPYYKVGRPGGCMVACQMVSIYYSTRTPPAEIERLTSYDFSCFTRFNPCARIVDLLPAAEEWHLYDSKYESSPTVLIPSPRPESDPYVPEPLPPCSNIPVWAQARDAHYALAVEALSTTIVKNQEKHQEYREVAKVRVVDSLKAHGPWLRGAIVSAGVTSWFSEASPPEHLVPGRRYIVFAVNGERTGFAIKDLPLLFDRCGVLEDTPEIRRELERGFAQNDTLRP